MKLHLIVASAVFVAVNMGSLLAQSDRTNEPDEKWRVAEATDFDAELFGLDAPSVSRLGEFIEEEREAISNLHDALAQQDKQKTITAARGLKPPFAKTYMLFGDFPEVASSDAKSKSRATSKKQ